MPSSRRAGKDSSDQCGPLLATHHVMQLTLDPDQVSVLREILQGSLTELRFESARADSHDYREVLHRRERMVEDMLVQLTGHEPVTHLPLD